MLCDCLRLYWTNIRKNIKYYSQLELELGAHPILQIIRNLGFNLLVDVLLFNFLLALLSA